MTEMNQLKYVENAIREALKPRQIDMTTAEVHMIRDHLTLNLFPDLIDRETFDSIVFSMYSVLVSGVQAERERTAGHSDKYEKLGPPDFICRR